MVRVVGVTRLVDDRVETVLLVSHVLDGPQGAVRVVNAVRSLNHVAVSVLVSGLVIAGVRVLYAVLVRILGMSLAEKKMIALLFIRPAAGCIKTTVARPRIMDITDNVTVDYYDGCIRHEEITF